MSDDANTFKCILEPYKTVGAQDLLKIGYQYYGHLRRRGKRDNLLSSIKSLSLKWRQKFVILSQGCVYCYGSEFSKSPSAAFSLSVYESVKDIADQDHMLHCFEIRHEDRTKPPQTFACETAEKRKEWIAHIKESIEQSHRTSQGSLPSEEGGSDEGISMGPAKTKRKPTRSLPPLPPVPDNEMSPSGSPMERRPKKPESEYDLEDEEELIEEKEYNDVDESTFNQPLCTSPKTSRSPVGRIELPDVTEAEQTGITGMADLNIAGQRQGLRTSTARPHFPVPLPKPSKASRDSIAYEDTEPSNPMVGKKPMHAELFTSASYLFDSNDRERARDTCKMCSFESWPLHHCVECMERPSLEEIILIILANRPLGTFLLRNGRADKEKKVLAVQTELGVKEFQIQHKGCQMTLNNIEIFEDLDRLLTHYHENSLPKNEYKQKLIKGYKK